MVLFREIAPQLQTIVKPCTIQYFFCYGNLFFKNSLTLVMQCTTAISVAPRADLVGWGGSIKCSGILENSELHL